MSYPKCKPFDEMTDKEKKVFFREFQAMTEKGREFMVEHYPTDDTEDNYYITNTTVIAEKASILHIKAYIEHEVRKEGIPFLMQLMAEDNAIETLQIMYYINVGVGLCLNALERKDGKHA